MNTVETPAVVRKISEKFMTRSERRYLCGGNRAHRAACRDFNRADRAAARRELRAVRRMES